MHVLTSTQSPTDPAEFTEAGETDPMPAHAIVSGGAPLSEQVLGDARRAVAEARDQAVQAAFDESRAGQDVHDALVRCIAALDRDVAAFVARKLLRPGHLCPVCGSGQHPAPARAGADTDGADYELEDARRRRDRAQERAQAALHRLSQAESRLAALVARRH